MICIERRDLAGSGPPKHSGGPLHLYSGERFIPSVSASAADSVELAPVDVLTGFLSDNGDAFGRLVGAVLDKHGALLAADYVSDVIWRVTSQVE